MPTCPAARAELTERALARACRSGSPLRWAFLFVSACANDDAGHTSAAFTARDSAGIRIVESRAPSWTKEEAWTIDTVPFISIGTLEGAPEYQLSDVSGVVQLADGRIVVAELRSRQLRAYASDGRFLWASGRPGQGPGDFGAISGLARYRGDSLLVFDFSLRRYTVFDSAGRFSRSFTAQLPASVTFSGELGFAGAWDDGSLAITRRPVRSGMSPPQVTRRALGLYRYDAEGNALALLAELPGQEYYEGRGALGSIMPLPFGRGPQLAIAGDRAWAGVTDTHEIRQLARGGAVQTILRRHLSVRAVTRDAIAAERARLRAPSSPYRGLPDSLLARFMAGRDEALAEMPFPATHPAYGALLANRDGYLWVQNADTTHRRWSVFHPDGHWLGDVSVPRRFTPYELSAQHVLGVQKDDLGVPFVRAFRLLRVLSSRRTK